MSIRFAIKNRVDKIEREGNIIVRYTGNAEPFTRTSERDAKKVGVDGGGNPKVVFNTGLDENKVQFFKWYNDEEKEVLKKKIKELKPVIAEYYGGKNVVEETNGFFWKDNRDVNNVTVTNQVIDMFFDTKNVQSALLYLSIASGAFIDTIAPTKDWAERNQLPHYMVLESEDVFEEEDEITRSDAHAALGKLRKDQSPDALFILAWCIQYDTNAYGAYLKSTPLKDLISYHIRYIDGKLTLKKKRNTPKVFLEYAQKWEGQQTRPALFTEAYVKAGEYYNFLKKRDKKYMIEDVEVGNTLNDVIATLSKDKFSQQYEVLRDAVEAKWKE